ncbi:Lrp/AsnC family transcriptional regulator [Luteithermobacter gelatinilyticus]|uniref:Lrp/AsnC family transcriptional regulator n=1 Tax=Luteithermobacter gelatinilyticus TaxID=2582913 RepID=UPI001105BD65|nr:Lrp/AsnC family transcriptional regulator [Luteithermobacter gelatinilyticus]|tara:strand:+ start:7311 stop:7784 length:474 start_codon:yes stop_codon:yes gene_type:complete
MVLDHIDFNILRELQSDGRLSNQELATRVGLSPSPCWRRVKRLEEEGIIKQYVALLDPDRIGLPIMAYCQVMLEKHQLDQSDQFDQMIRERAEVLEYYSMSGDYDFLLKVISRSIREYEEFQTQFLMRLPVVRSVSTSFVLRQKKHTTRLPLRFVEE